MFGHTALASNAYRRVAVESAALGADRHQLISLLLSNATTAIGDARAALRRGDGAAKVAAATRAMRLVDEGLKAAVDRRAGELGESLYQLYDYCGRRLLQAQLRNDDATFGEVAGLLAQIHDAWSKIVPDGGDPNLRRAA
jgi:flagellar protein FliS